MVKLRYWGAFAILAGAASPLAAQNGWVAIPQEGGCVVEYPMSHGTYRLRRTTGGVQTFTFSFMEDGAISRDNLKAEIKRDYYPDHYIGLSTRRDGVELSGLPKTEVIFEIDLTGDFLNWMIANKPGYAVKHKGKVIAAFGTLGLEDGRRLLDTCKPIVREANLRAKPLGDRSQWIEIAELQYHLPGREGPLSIAARLTVSTDGRARYCTVTASTGSRAADEAICARLKANARFKSATGGRGEPVAGDYEYKATVHLD